MVAERHALENTNGPSSLRTDYLRVVPQDPIQEPIIDARYSLACEGDAGSIFAALYTKKQLLQQGRIEEADRIRVGISLGPGGLQGFTHAALLIALRDEGLLSCVDRLVGVSTGADAAVVAIGLKDGSDGDDLYEIIAMNREVDGRRGLRAIDSARIAKRLREYVDIEKIQSSRTRVSVIVVDADTGQTHEIDIRDCPDPVAAAMASSAAPVASMFPYPLQRGAEEMHAMDGMFGNPYPTESQYDEMTHWLVVNPAPPNGFHDHLVRMMTIHPGLLKYRKGREVAGRLNEVHETALAKLRRKIADRYAIALMYPKKTYDAFTNDWANLRGNQASAVKEWKTYLQKAQALCMT